MDSTTKPKVARLLQWLLLPVALVTSNLVITKIDAAHATTSHYGGTFFSSQASNDLYCLAMLGVFDDTQAAGDVIITRTEVDAKSNIFVYGMVDVMVPHSTGTFEVMLYANEVYSLKTLHVGVSESNDILQFTIECATDNLHAKNGTLDGILQVVYKGGQASRQLSYHCNYVTMQNIVATEDTTISSPPEELTASVVIIVLCSFPITALFTYTVVQVWRGRCLVKKAQAKEEMVYLQ